MKIIIEFLQKYRLPGFREKTFQPESGKIAREGTFYVHREREREEHH